jgi:hypothetical protein
MKTGCGNKKESHAKIENLQNQNRSPPSTVEFIMKCFVVMFGPHRPMRNEKGQN